jgi:hypothetical protein
MLPGGAGMPKYHQMIQAFVLLCLIQINEGFPRRNYAAGAQLIFPAMAQAPRIPSDCR